MTLIEVHAPLVRGVNLITVVHFVISLAVTHITVERLPGPQEILQTHNLRTATEVMIDGLSTSKTSIKLVTA